MGITIVAFITSKTGDGDRGTVDQSGGGSNLRTETRSQKAARGPRIRQRCVVEGVQSRLRPGREEKRKPREGNAAHGLKSSGLRPRTRSAVPPARGEGGSTDKMAQPQGLGWATPGRRALGPSRRFLDLRNRKRTPGARPGESGRGRFPGSAGGCKGALGRTVSVIPRLRARAGGGTQWAGPPEKVSFPSPEEEGGWTGS